MSSVETSAALAAPTAFSASAKASRRLATSPSVAMISLTAIRPALISARLVSSCCTALASASRLICTALRALIRARYSRITAVTVRTTVSCSERMFLRSLIRAIRVGAVSTSIPKPLSSGCWNPSVHPSGPLSLSLSGRDHDRRSSPPVGIRRLGPTESSELVPRRRSFRIDDPTLARGRYRSSFTSRANFCVCRLYLASIRVRLWRSASSTASLSVSSSFASALEASASHFCGVPSASARVIPTPAAIVAIEVWPRRAVMCSTVPPRD